jgi:hypothetical protein
VEFEGAKMSNQQHTVQGGVAVPMLQSVVTGILFAFLVLTGYWLTLGFTAWRLFWFALAAGVFIAWLGALGKWRTWIDAVVGIDHQQQPTPVYQLETVQTYRLDIRWNDGQAGDWLDGFGTDWPKLRDWFVAVYLGRSLGESHWCGARAPFSKGEYHIMLDRLNEQGIIRARGKHHAQGYELTARGRAVARAFAERYHEMDANSPTSQRYLPG